MSVGSLPTCLAACILTGPIASVLFERAARHGFDHELQAFHRTGLAALVSYLVLLSVSWLYRQERSAEAEQYLWWRYRQGGDDEGPVVRPWWQRDGLWATLLAVATVALCVYFA